MLTDSTGLGFTIRGGEILVHYPTRVTDDAQHEDGAPVATHHYEAGWPIGPVPASYALDPPNAITAERVQLWGALRESRGAGDE